MAESLLWLCESEHAANRFARLVSRLWTLSFAGVGKKLYYLSI